MSKQTFRYGSKASEHMAIIQGAEPIYLPGTATMVGHQKEIVASFGEGTPEATVFGPDGEPAIDDGTGRPVGRMAQSRGHYFDSRAQQELKGWTDDEHDRVVARLDFLCTKYPSLLWKLEDVKAQAPLPNWDGLSAARKLAIAGEVGLLGEALNYERQQGTDPDLVERLQKKVDADTAERAAEEALVA